VEQPTSLIGALNSPHDKSAPTQQSGRHSASTARSISTIAGWLAMNAVISEGVAIKIASLGAGW
jgi:hypothetical protein